MSENEGVLLLIIELYFLIVILIKSFYAIKNDYNSTTWKEVVHNGLRKHEADIAVLNIIYQHERKRYEN
jgi:hypothetical protein